MVPGQTDFRIRAEHFPRRQPTLSAGAQCELSFDAGYSSRPDTAGPVKHRTIPANAWLHAGLMDVIWHKFDIIQLIPE